MTLTRPGRSERKGIKATSKALGSPRVDAYALGRGPKAMRVWLIVILFGYAVLFILSDVVDRTVILPGLLVVGAITNGSRPQRAIAVAEGRLVVMTRNFWNGRLRVLGSYPTALLRPVRVGGAKVKVAVGPDLLTFRRKVFDRLAAAASNAAIGAAEASVPGAAVVPTVPGWGAAIALQPRPRQSGRQRNLAGAGIFLLIAGALGLIFVTPTQNLAGLVVGTPAPGMIATAIGAGGQAPTHVLPGATQGKGIGTTGSIPTTPTIFLLPRRVTDFGIRTGTEPAYWKVWWDGNTQVKTAVCLQEHVNSSLASDEVTLLDNQNQNPRVFDDAEFSYTSSSEFDVPGVPGASGYLWEGTEDNVPIDVRIGFFSQGPVVALISMTAYRATTDPGDFLALARAEYATMPASPLTVEPGQVGLSLMILLGLGIIVLDTKRRWDRAAIVPNVWPEPPPPGGSRPVPDPGWLPQPPGPFQSGW